MLTDKIPVVVRHTKLTEAEEEAFLGYESMEEWEKSLPRQLVPKEEFAAYLERLSHNTERLQPAAGRVDLIVSFQHWPDFVLILIYDDYVE
ncbi:MAG: hypothetical protein PWQ97_429 [Tepidanaerobacteraceae bacterium]|nr:hypothetical protein [Tepidanaerobacteraceae bacterium]